MVKRKPVSLLFCHITYPLQIGTIIQDSSGLFILNYLFVLSVAMPLTQSGIFILNSRD